MTVLFYICLCAQLLVRYLHCTAMCSLHPSLFGFQFPVFLQVLFSLTQFFNLHFIRLTELVLNKCQNEIQNELLPGHIKVPDILTHYKKKHFKSIFYYQSIYIFSLLFFI